MDVSNGRARRPGWMRRVAAGGALPALISAGLAAGCGGGEAEVAGRPPLTTLADAADTTEVPAATTVPGPRCDGELLRRATAGYYPGARVSDEACLARWAIATVTSSRTHEAGVVVFFEANDQEWKLLKVEAADHDIEREAPAGFPVALIAAWQASYVPPTSSTTTTTTTRPPTTTTTTTPTTTTEAPTASTTEADQSTTTSSTDPPDPPDGSTSTTAGTATGTG
jgi:hypothetical protein